MRTAPNGVRRPDRHSVGPCPIRSDVLAEELPPLRMNADLVYVFDRLKVGSGCIILKFTPSGYVPLPLDENFAFVAGAMRPFGRPIAACPVPQPKTFSTTNYTTAKPSRAAYGASVNSQKGDAA